MPLYFRCVYCSHIYCSLCQPCKTYVCALHCLDCLQMFGVGAAGELVFKFRNKSRGWPWAAMHSMLVPNIRYLEIQMKFFGSVGI